MSTSLIWPLILISVIGSIQFMYWTFCQLLPVFTVFLLSRQKYFLPWQKPNPDRKVRDRPIRFRVSRIHACLLEYRGNVGWFHPMIFNGDTWQSPDVWYSIGMLPATESGQCAAEPPLRTGPLSSHVASADECAVCEDSELASDCCCGTCYHWCCSDMM